MSRVRWLGGLVAVLVAVPRSEARAQAPGELRGRVFDARTARAVAQAQVEVVGGASGRSDADGMFVLRSLEPGRYTVRVRAVGYLPYREDVVVANGRTTVLDAPLEPVPVDLAPITIHAIRDSAIAGVVQFDRGAIERSARRDVGELLESVPGVVITRAGGPGAPARVSIRGSGANEVLVLVDGVPVNSAVTGEVDLSQIPLESAERVTVRTGAQSARYGARAMAGVIDIQTRRPSREIAALGRAGAWGEHQSSLTLGDTRSLGALRLGTSVGGDYRDSHGDFGYDIPAVRGGGTADRRNADVTSRQVFGTVALEGTSWDGRARLGWNGQRRGMAGSIVQPSMTGRSSQDRRSGGLDARGRRGIVAWSWSADVSRERAAYDDPAPPFGTAFHDTVTATGVTGLLSATVGSATASAALGTDLSTLDVASTMLEADAPHWQRSAGVWTRLHTIRPLTAGLRLDGEVSARIDQTSLIHGSTVSPRAALGFATDAATLTLSLGAGYAPPSLSDQFFHEGVQVRANPSLQPERTRNDLEARLALRDRMVGIVQLGADAAVYRADIDGMILWQPDFRFIWSPSNFAVSRSGWELSGRVGAPSAHVDLRGMMARSDVRYRGTVLSGQVAYRPTTTGNATLGVGVVGIRLEATTSYVGERRTVAGSALNALDAYWRTDVRVARSVPLGDWGADISLGVDNALDKPAAMLVDYPFPGRAWSVALRLRRNGRNGP